MYRELDSHATVRFFNQKELLTMLGISRATFERNVAIGLLPKPIQVGKRAVRWRSDEIEACINNMPRLENAYACHVTGSGKGERHECQA